MGIRSASIVLMVSVGASCAFEPAGASAVAVIDGGSAADGAVLDGAPEVDNHRHLLLSEVKTGPIDLRFVEIYNPSCEAVDLSNFYIADTQIYALLPAWQDSPPELDGYDAVARFPFGAVLAPGAVAVIAGHENEFASAYGFQPDFAMQAPSQAPSLTFVAQGDNSNMVFAYQGETVILFGWDNESDLVVDIDAVTAGSAPDVMQRVAAKQDIAPSGVEGPDEDELATLYFPEEASLPAMMQNDGDNSSTAQLGSYQRILFEDGHELMSGGNGIDGHDETSENTRITWEQEVGTEPTPGEVPESLQVDCGSVGSGQ